MERPKPELDELKLVASSATHVANHIRQESKIFHRTLLDEHDGFNKSLVFSDGMWRTSQALGVKFFHGVKDADFLIDRDKVSVLAHEVDHLRKYKIDWAYLATFLFHDFYHISPIELFQLFIAVDSREENGQIRMFDRHKKYLDEVAQRGEEMASQLALPVEFVHDALLLETGEQIPTREFSPLQVLERIAFLIKGRFAVDDYNLLVNPKNIDKTTPVNRLIVRGDECLTVNTSEAMIFSVIYNLAKNAAKANAIKHWEDHDQALVKAYDNKGDVAHPRSLGLIVKENEDSVSFSVSDDANGLSLDGSLQRIHEELSRQIKQYGGNIRESEWYWNLRRTLGDQAELIIAWPSNPYALREVTVGSIMDCQFILAFSGVSWELRTFTSGMGLWGVRYLTERLGGTVIGTNKFEGGALFTVNIPKTSLGLY